MQAETQAAARRADPKPHLILFTVRWQRRVIIRIRTQTFSSRTFCSKLIRDIRFSVFLFFGSLIGFTYLIALSRFFSSFSAFLFYISSSAFYFDSVVLLFDDLLPLFDFASLVPLF